MLVNHLRGDAHVIRLPKTRFSGGKPPLGHIRMPPSPPPPSLSPFPLSPFPVAASALGWASSTWMEPRDQLVMSMNLTRRRVAISAIRVVAAVLLLALGIFLSKLMFHWVMKVQGESYVVRPDTGNFADLAIDEDASIVLADFRCHRLDELKRNRYLDLKGAGRIVQVATLDNAQELEEYVIKDGRIRWDLSTYEYAKPGEIAMAKIRMTSGPKKGVIGWLPLADIARKYAMP